MRNRSTPAALQTPSAAPTTQVRFTSGWLNCSKPRKQSGGALRVQAIAMPRLFMLADVSSNMQAENCSVAVAHSVGSSQI